MASRLENATAGRSALALARGVDGRRTSRLLKVSWPPTRSTKDSGSNASSTTSTCPFCSSQSANSTVSPIRLTANVSPIIRKHGFVKTDVYLMTLCRSGQFKFGSEKATTSQALRSTDRPRPQVTSDRCQQGWPFRCLNRDGKRRRFLPRDPVVIRAGAPARHVGLDNALASFRRPARRHNAPTQHPTRRADARQHPQTTDAPL